LFTAPRWISIAIYPMGSANRPLNKWGLVFSDATVAIVPYSPQTKGLKYATPFLQLQRKRCG